MFKEGSRPQKSYNSQEWDFSWELCLVLTLAETPRLERVIPPRGKIFIKLSHFSSDVSVANRFWRCAPLRFTERARAHPNTKSRCRWQKGGRTISLGKKFLRGYWGWPFVSDVWIAIIIIMCIYIYTSIYLVLSCWASEATNTSYHFRRENLTRSFQSEWRHHRSKSPSHWGRCSESWWRFTGVVTVVQCGITNLHEFTQKLEREQAHFEISLIQ